MIVEREATVTIEIETINYCTGTFQAGGLIEAEGTMLRQMWLFMVFFYLIHVIHAPAKSDIIPFLQTRVSLSPV